MSLRLICGRAGTGKSEYILNEIKEKIKQKEKILIVTPEQFSYAEEKKLLNKIEENSIVETQVLSFERMAHYVSTKIGGLTKQSLGKEGKAMLIYHILSDKKNSFNFLGKSKQNVDIIETQITEFKKHAISIGMLKKCEEQIEDKYMLAKLNDMTLIYEEYQRKIQNNYIEENDRLDILYNQLQQKDIFKDYIIYIDEFVGFTKQELNIIRELLKQAKAVNITITTDNLDMTTTADTDIFYYNKQTADKLLYIARSEEIKCEKTEFLNETHRYKNNELKYLEANLSKIIPTEVYNNKTENIKLLLASNPYEEVEIVAKEIIKLVKKNNYRYRDIAVITKNIEAYSSICNAIFNEYNIPTFIDQKKELSQNLLIKYLISILDIYAQNWSLDSVMNYIKTGFLNLDYEEIYQFENKVRKWGIKGSKWYNGEWQFEEETDENREMLNRIKDIRKQVILPLKEFKDDLSSAKTAENMTKRFYKFLIDNKIDRIINTLQEEQGIEYELVEEYKIAWEIVTNLLDEIIMLFKDEKFTFQQYSEIIRIGLNNSSLNIIPQTQDQVLVGDTERSKSHKIKALFILGVNDGIFPGIYKKEGFFQDKDRESLKQKGIELAKTTTERLYEDNFSTYKIFTMAEEKLYLSYSSSDMENKPLRPSIYIMKLKKIFKNVDEKSDLFEEKDEIINKYSTFESLINQIRKKSENEPIDSIWESVFEYYNTNSQWKEKLSAAVKALNNNEMQENITKENIEKLYGKKLLTTISRLEQYRSCPFSYFLKYGLKLTTQSNFIIQAIDTGTFMHDVIDSFFKLLEERNIKIKELEDEQIAELVNEIINDKLNYSKNFIFTSTDKYKVLTNRLKRLVTKSIKYMVEGLKNSDFEVFTTEAEFKEGAYYNPIEIELENNKKAILTGKIDRIDIAKTEEGNYIRIIDYKSSVKNIDLNEVVAGLQIQLLTYLDAACDNEKVMPAGVLYYNLIEPILKSDKVMDEQKIQEEIRKKYKMQGLILADVNIVKKMDKTLEKGQSDVVPAYIDKEGNLSKGKSNAITKDEFEVLQKYIKSTIKQISEEILSGNISKEPYYIKKNKKTPCEFCDFKSICNFKAGQCNNKYRFIENKKKEEVLQQINSEEEKK